MGKFLRYITITLPVWLVLIAFISCNDTGCMENRSSIPYVTIYSDSTVPQTIYIDSLTVYGVGQIGDSMLLDTAMNVSSMYLPLRDDKDTTRFVISCILGFTFFRVPFFGSTVKTCCYG